MSDKVPPTFEKTAEQCRGTADRSRALIEDLREQIGNLQHLMSHTSNEVFRARRLLSQNTVTCSGASQRLADAARAREAADALIRSAVGKRRTPKRNTAPAESPEHLDHSFGQLRKQAYLLRENIRAAKQVMCGTDVPERHARDVAPDPAPADKIEAGHADAPTTERERDRAQDLELKP